MITLQFLLIGTGELSQVKCVSTSQKTAENGFLLMGPNQFDTELKKILPPQKIKTTKIINMEQLCKNISVI